MPGLFTYEFCLTFGREVELFWRRKFTIASVLVILNRYVPLVVNLMDTPYVIPHAVSSISLGYYELFQP